MNAPAAVEILGPPGAGKTALSSAVCARGNGIRPLSIYLSPRRLPRHLLDGLALLPMSLLQTLRTPFIAREFRLLLRLEGAPRVLERASGDGLRVAILDQGPLFALVRLRAGLPEPLRFRSSQAWWDRMVEIWAGSLDLLVLVDAPDEVLLDRIRTRAKDHRLKETDVGAREGLAVHRMLQEAVIEELRVGRDIPTLRFDTSRHSVRDMAAEVAVALGRVKTPTAGLSSASPSGSPPPTGEA